MRVEKDLSFPGRHLRKVALSFVALCVLGTLTPAPASAYVGPGAGFAFVSSFLALFAVFILVCVSLMTWPIRLALRAWRRRKAQARGRADVRRVVVLGLDGLDPQLARDFMDKGLLPHFRKLREEGSFAELGTTHPAESPVAWSSFQTGCNPGKHRIFDFLTPNRGTYLPELSSARILPSPRSIRLGARRIAIGRPTIRSGRKSRSFWKVLSDHGIFSTVQRVPITFPPEKIDGVLLSGMCVPDIVGSQGTYFLYSNDPLDRERNLISGRLLPVDLGDDGEGKLVVKAQLEGPGHRFAGDGAPVRVPFEIRVRGDGAHGDLIVGGRAHPMTLGEYTPWISLGFKVGLGARVRGICRFYLIETSPRFRLYVTPIHIDPYRPALPISHPFSYAPYLARTQGAFATLGVAEDTSALNEGVIDEDAFLQQTYAIHRERERMLFDALEKTPRGCVVCVFDISDRVQHMFFRCLEEDHPANRGRDAGKHRGVIQRMYEDLDDLLGRVMAEIDERTVLLVMSDHGFKSFRREVNLNTWLYRNGYMALKTEKPSGKDMFQDVDWSKTRAYSLGFAGIYLNLVGREKQGVVKGGEEAEALKREIARNLQDLSDGKEKSKPVCRVYSASEVYSGPYVSDAPDLIVGFRAGYRMAWNAVTGGLSDAVIEDNTRLWSGDHNFDPSQAPGALFCNRKILTENANIVDIAPTALDLLGVDVPEYCDGRSLLGGESARDSRSKDRATSRDAAAEEGEAE
jgi:predicted AlkP superfamily phosphohydrolase/phosphomutase